MKHLIAALVFFTAFSAGAESGYGSCYVENGTAHALFCSQGSASQSGTGYVTTYDRSGGTLDRSMMVWVGIAIMGCDEVGTVSVDSDAVGCSFDLGN